MTVNFGGVIRLSGLLLIIIGLAMVPCLLLAYYYKEYLALMAFIVTIIPTIIIGIFLFKILKPMDMRLKTRDGFLIVSMSWLLSSLVGAIPFTISGAIPSYVDAFFETCSGFSTTGSSILSDIEALPKSILFWRSFTHWIGGMGIIVFATALLPAIGIEGQLIASAETPGPTLDKLTPRFSDTARRLYLMYLAFTICEAFLLFVGGMSPYDSLIHTFSTVGTGGFSSYGDSIAHFDSYYLQWVIIIFMILCGINFNLYFLIPKKNGLKKMFKDEELRMYLGIIGTCAALIALYLILSRTYTNIGKAITDSFFQVVSIITTTGFATANYDVWPTFCKMLILLLLLIGACSSSTGGGVKIIRILVGLKLVRRSASLRLHPNRVSNVRFNGKTIGSAVAYNITNFIFLYIFVIFVGSFVIALNGFDILTSISAVMTCVGNVGPGFNLVGPTMNFSIFSDFSKIVLSLLMIAGRLELFTFFMLFSPHYWNSNRI